MRVMFLDESGTHNLSKRVMKGNCTLFVLGGVIIDREYLRTTVEPQMNQFKQQYFGRTDVVLHTVDMRNGGGDYAFLADPVLRTGFYSDLNALLQAWDYKVIGCVIDKLRYVARYAYPADPYHYSLDILVERFCWELGAQLDAGFICAEKRGDDLDRALMEAWENLRTHGTQHCGPKRIDNRIIGLDLRDKKPNLAGLQLADLVVTPIGRGHLNLPARPFEVKWSVVQSKLRRVGGSYVGKGLVVRP